MGLRMSLLLLLRSWRGRSRALLALTAALALGLVACSGSEDGITAGAAAPPPLSSLPASAEAIGDAEAAQLLRTLSAQDGTPAAAEAALARVLAAADERFIAVLIELLRGNQIEIVAGAGIARHIEALEALSGQAFGEDWPGWVEWYGATELVPPPGFTGWKGELLGRIDPGFAAFLRDEFPVRIRTEEIVWGGVMVDGIPALDQPRMMRAEEADYLFTNEPVFGIAINGEARAYPLRIMDWHEMANDVVGGVPVSLAYCTLCGAGIAYDGRASDGVTYDFGASGFLFRSNKLMYDRQTRTLWNQFTGEPVLGPLAGAAAGEDGAAGAPLRLKLLPVVLTTWAEWQQQHPDTLVLHFRTGYARPYEVGAAYGDYFTSSDTMFPAWQRDDLLETKQRVYALRVDGVPKAYPLDVLTAAGVVNDTLAGTPLTLVAACGEVETYGSHPRAGPVNYGSGGEVRAFARGERSFRPGPAPDIVLDERGRAWQVTEQALLGPGGERAPRVNGHLAYWFGWFAFFPNTLVYGEH